MLLLTVDEFETACVAQPSTRNKNVPFESPHFSSPEEGMSPSVLQFPSYDYSKFNWTQRGR